MVIMSNKKFKAMERRMLIMSSVGIVTGVTGITLSTVALAKESGNKKNMNQKIQNVESHLAAVEKSCSKVCKSIVPMQQTMLSAGLLKRD